MREIFLGKPWHWALLAIIIALLWWAGSAKAHVIQFNSFLIALGLGSLAVIMLILKTTKPGERITREHLDPDAEDEGEAERQATTPDGS